AKKIVLLIVLATLVLICFLSDRLAGRFSGADEGRKAKLSLLIKLGCAAVALIIYLIVFM
ncbi:MAG: hypothetical protein IJ240_00290, partial [Clostridia bacterium]|nr:hypothetical protein [Clostridia bacterium]